VTRVAVEHPEAKRLAAMLLDVQRVVGYSGAMSVIGGYEAGGGKKHA
jgi:hypothetical protein